MTIRPWVSPTSVLCHCHAHGLSPTVVLCHHDGVQLAFLRYPWVTQRRRRTLHPRLYYVTATRFCVMPPPCPWVVTHGCVMSPPRGYVLCHPDGRGFTPTVVLYHPYGVQMVGNTLSVGYHPRLCYVTATRLCVMSPPRGYVLCHRHAVHMARTVDLEVSTAFSTPLWGYLLDCIRANA